MKSTLKKIIKKFCRKSTYIKGAIILITAIAAVAQFIKQSFFAERPKETLALFAILFYIFYSDVNEHFILAIAMFLCLYFSYDTLTSFMKNEIKSRNNQIYSLLANNVEKQMNNATLKKVRLSELKNLIKNVNSISSAYTDKLSYGNNVPAKTTFTSNVVVEKNINVFLLEEIAYLDFLYQVKKELFERSNNSFDAELEFTSSKLDELV